MIAVTPDANVLASGSAATEYDDSPPVLLIRAWTQKRLTFVLSEELIREVERTLTNPYFSRLVSDDARHHQAIERLRANSLIVEPSRGLSGVASHAEDDRVLATAVSGGARFLVTGDHDLLRLGRYQDVTILTVRAFLATLPGLLDEQLQ